MTQRSIRANDTVDFSKKGGQFKSLGKCVVVEVKIGRVQNKYVVAVQDGVHAGTNRILTLRFNGPSNGELSYYCDVVGADQKTADAYQVKKQALQAKRYQAADEASTKYEAGDIVSIETSKNFWNMKVLEVDYKKGRIYGVNADTWYPGAKRAWASLTHPDVKITMKQKQAFDPKTDETVAQQKERAAQAGAKRAATRARREFLRSIF